MSTREKSYLWFITAAALPVYVYSLYQTFSHAHREWLFLAGLTIVASCFPIRLFSIRGRIFLTLSDAFVVVAIWLYGPAIAVVVASLDALTFNLRRRPKKASRWLFNVGQIVLTAFVVGEGLTLLREAGNVVDGRMSPLGAVVLLAAFLGGLYYLLSSSFTTLAVAIDQQESFLQVWKRNLVWICPSVIGTCGILAGYSLLL